MPGLATVNARSCFHLCFTNSDAGGREMSKEKPTDAAPDAESAVPNQENLLGPGSSPAEPNQYHLSGTGISLSYYPDGFGPVRPGQGRAVLFYQDTSRSLAFGAGEIRTVDVPDLGEVLSVTTVKTTDIGDTSFSFVLPSVRLPGELGAAIAVDTFGVITLHRTFLGEIGHPQHESYTTVALSGTASVGMLPV